MHSFSMTVIDNWFLNDHLRNIQRQTIFYCIMFVFPVLNTVSDSVYSQLQFLANFTFVNTSAYNVKNELIYCSSVYSKPVRRCIRLAELWFT